MPRPRTTYTAEFKLAAVKMITEQKLSVAEVARPASMSPGGFAAPRLGAQGGPRRRRRGLPRSRQPDPGRRRIASPACGERAAPSRAGPVKKSRRVLRQPAHLTFLFIADHVGEWPAAWMCEALEVSVSGYHAWASRPDSSDRSGGGRNWSAHDRGGPRRGSGAGYGSPRMTAELNARGYECSEKHRGRTLMREHGIRAKAPRRFVRIDGLQPLPSGGRKRPRPGFRSRRPERAAGAPDITDIPTGEGWLYLAVVEDLFSRMIVGWSMDATTESRLVVDALEMAIQRRRPEAGLLAHSDRGSQYASEHYQRVLSAEGIVCSMSGVGQCWDNAPMESFFGRLKCELVSGEMFATRDQARAEIFEYLEVFHNRVRRHSSLGFLPPEEFERTYNQKRR